MTIDTAFFTHAMAAVKLSQNQLARLIGVDPGGLSRALHGKREMRTHEAASIARLLGVPISQVLQAAGIEVPAEGTVPLVGHVDTQGEVMLDLEASAERVEAPHNMPEGTVAIISKGRTGPWQLLDGWMYYFPAPSGIAADIIGKFSAVRTGSGMTILRYVTRGYKQGTYNLDAIGAVPIEDTPLEWATPILWIKPRV